MHTESVLNAKVSFDVRYRVMRNMGQTAFISDFI